MKNPNIIKVGKYTVQFTNQDKIFFPDDKITKGDIIQYYDQIAPYMLKYTKNRALTMLRYPHGITQEGFYHKDAPDYFPDWIKRFVDINGEDKKVHYVVANNAATLVYLANFGCLIPHLWLSKIDKPNYPDRMIFDLDPSDDKSFKRIMETAKAFKKIIEEHNLVPFVMSTGSRGLHVVVPIKRTKTFDEVKKFAQYLAQKLIEKDPEHLTMEIRKNKRGTRIFIDTLRNGYGATAVAPYAVRAKPGAPVAFPLEWNELNAKLTPTKYNIFTIFKRLDKVGDIWKNIDKQAKAIPRY
ncbi:MAG: non-homologous end-joining DNA ligase [Candidatus Babeliales bacterium]|nr:non-homologous end-joining DNA ligase [Candidatus Babeliales bacterium]